MNPGFDKVREILRAGVGTAFPGAVLRVSRRGRLLFEEAVGRIALPEAGGPDGPVTPDTVFDLASLTKPLATTTVMMALVARGRLAPDDPVGRWVPDLAGTDKMAIPLSQLLAHVSGLPPWRPFGEWLLREHGPAFAGTPEARSEVLRRIGWATLESARATSCVYSDLGFILLGWALEAAGAAPLDRLFADVVACPLELPRVFFAPVLAGLAAPFPVPLDQVAATELCPTRRRVLRGEVHDDNAYLLGGVAGHAGLFGTAAAVDAIVTALHTAWRGGDGGPFDSAVVRRFWTVPRVPGSTRVWGFDTPSPVGSSAGARPPARAVGHLGFTGTSFWLDLDEGVVVTLLTHRVHPSRWTTGIHAFRPALHDAVWTALHAA